MTTNYSYNHNPKIFLITKNIEISIVSYNSHISLRKGCDFLMIMKKWEEHRTIESRNAKEFDELLRKAMEPIRLKEPEVTRFFEPSIGHCAYIKWTEEVTEPEDERDEFKLKGIEYVCGECPLYVVQSDKRIKRTICNKGERTWYDHPACNCLYEMVKKGDVIL